MQHRAHRQLQLDAECEQRELKEHRGGDACCCGAAIYGEFDRLWEEFAAFEVRND